MKKLFLNLCLLSLNFFSNFGNHIPSHLFGLKRVDIDEFLFLTDPESKKQWCVLKKKFHDSNGVFSGEKCKKCVFHLHMFGEARAEDYNPLEKSAQELRMLKRAIESFNGTQVDFYFINEAFSEIICEINGKGNQDKPYNPDALKIRDEISELLKLKKADKYDLKRSPIGASNVISDVERFLFLIDPESKKQWCCMKLIMHHQCERPYMFVEILKNSYRYSETSAQELKMLKRAIKNFKGTQVDFQFIMDIFCWWLNCQHTPKSSEDTAKIRDEIVEILKAKGAWTYGSPF